MMLQQTLSNKISLRFLFSNESINDIKISSQYRQNPKNEFFLLDFDDEKQAEEMEFDQESEKNNSVEKVENSSKNMKSKESSKYKETIPAQSNGIIPRSHVENKSLANFVGSIMSHTPCGPNEKKGTEMSCWK